MTKSRKTPVADKPVSAEEVIGAARSLLVRCAPLRLMQSGTHTTAGHDFWSIANALQDLLDRYDAQPKPRWLKPKEVREEAFYWVSYDPIDDNPREVESVEYVVVKNGVAKLSMSLVHCRFYGPLPEPPPPEGE